MPKYAYQCMACKEFMEIVHNMETDKKQCPLCYKEGYMKRLPNTFYLNIKKDNQKLKIVGKIVGETINELKEEFEREKEKARGEIYDPSSG